MYSKRQKKMEEREMKQVIPDGNSYQTWLDRKTISLDTSLTPKQIEVLEEAFLNMATDREASFAAGVPIKIFKRYCERNPDFQERKEMLSSMAKYQAKRNIVAKVLSGDVDMSKWLADRLLKEEGFTTRTEITGANNMPLINIVNFAKNEPLQTAIDGEVTIDKEETKELTSPNKA